MSRWRTGGQTSFDLVREFVQELPHMAPSDAWQRAVLSDSGIAGEPRERAAGEARRERPAAHATHPFFWAGYMLVDTSGGTQKSDAAPEEPVIKIKKKEPAGAAADKEPVRPAGPNMTLGPADLAPGKAVAAPAAGNPAVAPAAGNPAVAPAAGNPAVAPAAGNPDAAAPPASKATSKGSAQRKPAEGAARGIPPADEK